MIGFNNLQKTLCKKQLRESKDSRSCDLMDVTFIYGLFTGTIPVQREKPADSFVLPDMAITFI